MNVLVHYGDRIGQYAVDMELPLPEIRLADARLVLYQRADGMPTYRFEKTDIKKGPPGRP